MIVKTLLDIINSRFNIPFLCALEEFFRDIYPLAEVRFFCFAESMFFQILMDGIISIVCIFTDFGYMVVNPFDTFIVCCPFFQPDMYRTIRVSYFQKRGDRICFKGIYLWFNPAGYDLVQNINSFHSYFFFNKSTKRIVLPYSPVTGSLSSQSFMRQ